MNESLKTSLNAIREISSEIYHRYVPIIDENTDIATFANPIMNYPVVYNEFQNQLINKLVFTQFEMKAFRNPLVVLEGDALPLGYGGENIYVNPAKGRQFNVNDFAGLLVKYESDVKVEYLTLNMDLQYCVTYTRQQLKKAFRCNFDAKFVAIFNQKKLSLSNSCKFIIIFFYKWYIRISFSFFFRNPYCFF